MVRRSLIMLPMIVALSFFTTLTAQGVSGYGISIGMNHSNITIDDLTDDYPFKDSSPTNLYSAGAFLTYDINDMVAIQPELHYSTKGWIFELEEEGASVSAKFNINYVELPVLVLYSLGPVTLQAGPYVSFFMNGEVETKFSIDIEGESFNETDTEELEKDEFTSPEFGFVVGASVGFGNLSIGGRYSTSLVNIAQVTDADDDEPIPDFRYDILQAIVSFEF